MEVEVKEKSETGKTTKDMPSVQSKETDKESEKKLQCLYRHIALNLVVLTAPFTQRADLFLTFPEFGTFVFYFRVPTKILLTTISRRWKHIQSLCSNGNTFLICSTI